MIVSVIFFTTLIAVNLVSSMSIEKIVEEREYWLKRFTSEVEAIPNILEKFDEFKRLAPEIRQQLLKIDLKSYTSDTQRITVDNIKNLDDRLKTIRHYYTDLNRKVPTLIAQLKAVNITSPDAEQKLQKIVDERYG
ncbi:uncharacterized protein LOC141858458 [Brevipalpus obovatus]|uniref:uncharacterized protein LOC141858458 n=1 Tax=Brevipalpus obovatus TaxID=246614 RepID=UPI003D9E15B1